MVSKSSFEEEAQKNNKGSTIHEIHSMHYVSVCNSSFYACVLVKPTPDLASCIISPLIKSQETSYATYLV
jgi:hypothetical protein